MSGTKNQPKGKAGAAAGNRGSGGPPAGKEAQRAARRVEMVGVDTPVSSPEELPRMLQRKHWPRRKPKRRLMATKQTMPTRLTTPRENLLHLVERRKC